MKNIAILYHSGFGHTEVLAQAILRGVETIDGVAGQLIKAEDATDNLENLDKFDGIIFGSPTYMGSVSAPFKAFMDASSKSWFNQKWKNKIAAGFTNSHSLSGDKLNVLIQLAIFAAQHGMIWVGQAELNGSPDGKAGDENAVNRIGSMLGVMAQSENDSPEVTPPKGDLKTAEILGQRVAKVALVGDFSGV